MLIAELIQKLTDIQATVGNVPVVLNMTEGEFGNGDDINIVCAADAVFDGWWWQAQEGSEDIQTVVNIR